MILSKNKIMKKSHKKKNISKTHRTPQAGWLNPAEGTSDFNRIFHRARKLKARHSNWLHRLLRRLLVELYSLLGLPAGCQGYLYRRPRSLVKAVPNRPSFCLEHVPNCERRATAQLLIIFVPYCLLIDLHYGRFVFCWGFFISCVFS